MMWLIPLSRTLIMSSYLLILHLSVAFLLVEAIPSKYSNNQKAFEHGRPFVPPENFTVPDSIDWREKGVLNEIKDQWTCGSCWAFAVIGAIEPHLSIYQNLNVTLSEQNIVDCTNITCQPFNLPVSTWFRTAYEYVIENEGVDDSNSYPYESATGQCRYEKTSSTGPILSDYVTITPGDEEELKVAVASAGPVSAMISDHGFWYRHPDDSSVSYKEDCPKDVDELTHAVVIVGYGTTDKGVDYWLIRNSWGRAFGEGGYLKMTRNQDNNCGIATLAMYPLII